MAALKKSTQEGDIKFPNPPQDGISSISVNGSEQVNTTMVIATSWDNTVSFLDGCAPQTHFLTTH